MVRCNIALARTALLPYLVHRSNTASPGCLPFLDVSSLNSAVPLAPPFLFVPPPGRDDQGRRKPQSVSVMRPSSSPISRCRRTIAGSGRTWRSSM